MTAQTVESAPLPHVPKNIAGIRALLPEHRLAEFEAELLAAVDSEDLDVIRRLRKRWWVLAAFETDPSLRNLPENEPMFPSPFHR
jgi:hypothetical protein